MYGYPVTNRVIRTTKGYPVTLGAGGYYVTLSDTALAPVPPRGTSSSTIDGSYGLITAAPATENPLTAQIIVARERYYQLWLLEVWAHTPSGTAISISKDPLTALITVTREGYYTLWVLEVWANSSFSIAASSIRLFDRKKGIHRARAPPLHQWGKTVTNPR